MRKFLTPIDKMKAEAGIIMASVSFLMDTPEIQLATHNIKKALNWLSEGEKLIENFFPALMDSMTLSTNTMSGESPRAARIPGNFKELPHGEFVFENGDQKIKVKFFIVEIFSLISYMRNTGDSIQETITSNILSDDSYSGKNKTYSDYIVAAKESYRPIEIREAIAVAQQYLKEAKMLMEEELSKFS